MKTVQYRLWSCLFWVFLSHTVLFPADHQVCSCITFISNIITVAEMKEKKQHFRLSLIKHWMNIWWRLLTSILKNKAYWGSYRSVYDTDRPATWQNSHPFSPCFIHLREKQNEKYTKYEERVSKSSEQWELYVCLLTGIKHKMLLQSSSKEFKIPKDSTFALHGYEWAFY